MMKQIVITYIDDSLDAVLSEYLEQYKYGDYKIDPRTVEFDSNKGYSQLINDENVTQSNVIIIDSRLFENQNTTNKQFTGEEFKLILKRVFPYIEVIVITQNDTDEEYQTVKKYNSTMYDKTPIEYYTEILKSKIDNAIQNIIEFNRILQKMNDNPTQDRLLIEKLSDLLNGIKTEYSELNSQDIDRIINIFEEIRGKFNE